MTDPTTTTERAGAPQGPLGPGDPAPDFTLPDAHGTPVHLADLRGTPVVLVFFPGAFSGVCTGEVQELRDHVEDFESAGAQLLAISCDTTHVQRAWAEQEGLNFDLLSDFWPHGEVARAYGALNETTGRAQRASFLVDADGIIRWSVLNEPGQPRDLDGYREALARL